MIGIYKITSPKNKIYIGQSIDIEKRFSSYFKLSGKNKTQIKLFRSFLKHGVDNHIFEIIEECDIKLLNERERYWQDFYNVLDKGLNCRLTTSLDKSGTFSDESKLKMSKAWKNRVVTEEHKRNISKSNTRPMLGKNHSKETIELISKNRKGKSSRLGAKLSEDSKLKIALKAKGRKASDETKLKMSISRKGIKQNEDLKNKRALAQTKIILNTITGIYYYGLDEASKSVSMNKSTLADKLRGKYKNNTNFIYA
jgi:group I intron endonuclease